MPRTLSCWSAGGSGPFGGFERVNVGVPAVSGEWALGWSVGESVVIHLYNYYIKYNLVKTIVSTVGPLWTLEALTPHPTLPRKGEGKIVGIKTKSALPPCGGGQGGGLKASANSSPG